MVKKSILAASTLVGTIIGAGIFGIPYVVSKSGFLVGQTHILIIAILSVITMLYLGEISLRTKENNHMAGYAERYLGKKGRTIMLSALVFGTYSAAIAYLIGIGESLSFLLFSTNSYSLYLGVFFWVIISIISYYGLKALQDGEFIGVSIILILIISMLVFFVNKIDPSNFIQQPLYKIQDYFIPFGVVLFAFLGYTTIPEVRRMLKNKEKEMRPAILLATLTCTVIYILFTAMVIGVKGAETPEIATISLGKPFIFLGLLTIFTSYLAVSVALIDVLHLDFNLSKKKSWLWTTIIPLPFFIILQLTNFAHFTKVLGIGGAVSGGLTAILILLMINNAKALGDRKPEYSVPAPKLLIWIIIILLALGTIAEIINAI